MLLVVTNECDPHVDVVLSKLACPRFRLDIEDLLSGTVAILEQDEQLVISSSRREVRGEDISVIWWRKPMFPPGHGLAPSTKASWEFLLDNLAALLEHKHWLNSPSAYWRTSKKLYQLRLAQRHGLAIPKSLFTTTPKRDDVTSEQVLCKSIVTQHSLQGTHPEVSPGNVLLDREQVPEQDVYPALFQEFIPRKTELRLTVVGQEVFGASLHTGGDYVDIKELLDYEVTPFNTPGQLARRLIAIMSETGLKYCAFDFVVDRDSPLFLEMNPNGQWLWIEAKLGLDISGAVAKYFEELLAT